MASEQSIATPRLFTVDSLTDEESERLFSKIVFDPETDCWNWTGTLGGRGYGQIRFRGRKMAYVHRLMYAWLLGPLPTGIGSDIPTVDHTCENYRCCNPLHLQLLSQRNNILKGGSISAEYARRTHCKHGHLLDGLRANSRYCKTCNRASSNAYSQRKRAESRLSS